MSTRTPPQLPPTTLQFAVEESPSETFDPLVDRLTDGLGRLGIRVELRPGGVWKELDTEFGRSTASAAGGELSAELRPVTWGDSPAVTVRFRIEPIHEGSCVTLTVDGWPSVLEASGGGLLDWYAGTLLPSVLRQLGPRALGDWVTDRHARRPSGEAAVSNYRDPTYHWPNFFLIFDRIGLTANDRLLEVACGGGAFLKKALSVGCSAIAVDHSPDMVRTAKELNGPAIEAGRLTVLSGEAGHLPVPDDSFTCCVCTGAFSFFPDPVASLREMHRALAPGGRVAVYVGSAALRGTPAAPEPVASRLNFYGPEELSRFARDVGFVEVRVEAPDMEPYARRAGLPEEAVTTFFRGTNGGHLLLARKPEPP